MHKASAISRKQISINIIANVVSYSANIIVSFILTPYLINVLGKETYSFFPIANTIISYMSVLTNALNSMASRFVTVSIVKQKTDDANKYFSSTLMANLLMCGVLLVPLTLVVFFLDRILNIPVNSEAAIKGLFALVFSSGIVNVSAAVFGIATFAKNRLDLRSARELVTAILRLLLFFFFYRFLTPSIVYVGVVALIVALANIIFQVFYTKSLLPEISIKKEYMSASYIRELAGASCWNAINSIGNILLSGMTLVLANVLFGAEASGTFSIVSTVPQFINGVIVMLVGVFYPVITYKFANNDFEGVVEEVKNAQKFVGVFGCATISVFSALASEFFSLWVPNENSYYLAMLSFLTIIPHLFISCMWPLTNVNIVMNKVKKPAQFTLTIGVLNVLLSYVVFRCFCQKLLLLPVISSFLQIIWIGVFIPIYVSKNMHISRITFYPTLIEALICSAITFASTYYIKRLFIVNSWLSFILIGICTGTIALALFGIVLLKPKKIKQFVSSIKRS